MPKINHDKLDADATCVLCRMDTKGESLEQATEAVLGDAKSAYAKKVMASLRGEKVR